MAGDGVTISDLIIPSAFVKIIDKIQRSVIFTEWLGFFNHDDDVVQIGEEEKQLALSQPWQGSPALMVSDGLFSFGADLLDEAS